MNEKIKFFVKVIVSHVITYMVAGFIAFNLFHNEHMPYYMELMGFKPTEEINGLVLIIGQIVRGFLLGIVIWWIKDIIIDKKLAWLKLWMILIILGIFNTYGPAHGSIEGFIYLDSTRFEEISVNPILSMLEVLIQPLFFSIIICINWKELKNKIKRRKLGK